MRVLDAAGNVTDAAFLCCLTALLAFKRPEVSVENSEDGSNPSIKVHPVEEREALPLSLHQSPIAVSFALFQVKFSCYFLLTICSSLEDTEKIHIMRLHGLMSNLFGIVLDRLVMNLFGIVLNRLVMNVMNRQRKYW